MSKRKNSHIVAVTEGAARNAMNQMERGFYELPEGTESLPFGIDDVCIASRDLLEIDESFKQLIPYIIVERDGKILLYRRTPAGGEGRLHGNTSIGLGGHIDIKDVEPNESGQAIDLETTVAVACQRELQEELKMGALSAFEVFGLLYENGNAVSRVHLGVVMIARVSGMVVANEDQIELMGFKSIEELVDMTDEMEVWSQTMVAYLNKNGIPK